MNNKKTAIGSTLTLTCTDTTILSSGVARIDGAVVFTDGAVEGDTVLVTITDVKKNFAKAKLSELISQSKYRRIPDCPVFEKCGGCSFRHIDYEYEKQVKKRAVEAAFRRASLSAVPVRDIISAGCDRYRNKAVLHYDSDGSLGYYEASSKSSVFPIDYDCKLHPEFYAKILAFVFDFFADKPQKPTYIYIRSSKDKSVVTVGTENGRITDELKAFASAISHEDFSPDGIFAGSGNSPEDGELRYIYGNRSLCFEFCGLSVNVSPSSFFQVNLKAAEMLAYKVIEYAKPQRGDLIADLYCGTGILGMAIAKNTPDAKIIGVEINDDAVKNAKENAVVNGLHNISFFTGDSKDFASHLGNGSLAVAVIDPPRKGCSPETLEELVRLSPERIVYVSCNPATLARDLSVLAASGYSALEATPVDMFPKTGHVETVVLLSKLPRVLNRIDTDPENV